MAEKIIISKVDIQEFYNVPQTLDDARAKIAILEAQQGALKRILGQKLYYEFIEDYDDNKGVFTTAKYQTLFNGGSYIYSGDSIYFSGIRHLLCSHSYINLAKNNKIHIVRAGVVVKSVEQSETAENFELRAILRGVYDQASRVEAEVCTYLSLNPSDFPLYAKRETSDQKRTGVNFYRVY